MRSWVNESSLYLPLSAVSASNLYVNNPIAIEGSTINIDIQIDQAVKTSLCGCMQELDDWKLICKKIIFFLNHRL